MSREMVNSGIPWIGDIPKGWNIENIGSCLKEVRNLNSDCSEDNALQFKMGTIISKKHGDSKYNPETLEAYNKVQVGDIVINGLNLSFDFISMRVGQVKENGVITSAYLTVRPLSHLDSDYVTYLFKGYDACKALHGMGKGLRQTLSYKEFRKYLIFHPSLSEQQKVASFLDRKCCEIDEMIALQEKIVEELKAYKQSVITEAVTKGLNPDVPMKDSGIEWIGEIPKHWSIDKIIRSFGLIGSGTTPKSTDEDNFNGNIRWIQSGDINGGVMTECKNRISEKTLHTTSALKIYNPPFIIIAMYGASVGNTSISMIDGCVNQACCVLSESHLNLEYSFNVIKSCKDFWIRKAVGGGQPNISQDTIKSTWIPIPPKEEQKQIASYLNTKCTEIDNLISIKLSKIDSLKEYKKSIIYEYVTGKKEVTE